MNMTMHHPRPRRLSQLLSSHDISDFYLYNPFHIISYTSEPNESYHNWDLFECSRHSRMGCACSNMLAWDHTHLWIVSGTTLYTTGITQTTPYAYETSVTKAIAKLCVIFKSARSWWVERNKKLYSTSKWFTSLTVIFLRPPSFYLQLASVQQ